MARYKVYIDSGVLITSEETNEATLRQLAKEKFLKMLKDDQFDLFVEEDVE